MEQCHAQLTPFPKVGDDLHHMDMIFGDFWRFSAPICINSAIFGPDFWRFLAIFGPDLHQFGDFRPRFWAIFGDFRRQKSSNRSTESISIRLNPICIEVGRELDEKCGYCLIDYMGEENGQIQTINQ